MTERPAAPQPGPDEEQTVEITVGRVGRAHGLRGDVFVEVRTDDPGRRFAVGTTFTTPRGDLVVAGTHWHGSRLLVSFDGVGEREAAERLRGLDLVLEVARDERPDDPEEFYDHQLKGLAAHTGDGRFLGTVADVLHLPTQDTLVLEVDGREVLVPFVAEIVPVVDLAAGRVEVVELPGLLEQPEEGLP